ncbi:MAG: MerR family transcriptional regulator [Nitrospinae bacterium]|nr:MerR family transcriptional regulator [Nitrospinota bacterium]
MSEGKGAWNEVFGLDEDPEEERTELFTISIVSRMYSIHPQTLRLYEREGLLLPHRSEGNRRLYSREDLRRLKIILNLTRDLGVNLAGVDIILGMRERMRAMQREIQEFVTHLQQEVMREAAQQDSRGMPIPVRMASTLLAKVKEVTR